MHYIQCKKAKNKGNRKISKNKRKKLGFNALFF